MAVKSVYFCDICGENFNPNNEFSFPNEARIFSYRIVVDGVNIVDDNDYHTFFGNSEVRDTTKECFRCVCLECRQKIGEFIRGRKRSKQLQRQAIIEEFNSEYVSE